MNPSSARERTETLPRPFRAYVERFQTAETEPTPPLLKEPVDRGRLRWNELLVQGPPG